jgi:hypothetical protein
MKNKKVRCVSFITIVQEEKQHEQILELPSRSFLEGDGIKLQKCYGQNVRCIQRQCNSESLSRLLRQE